MISMDVVMLITCVCVLIRIELDAIDNDNCLDSSALSSQSNRHFNRSTSNPDLSPSSISNKSMSSSTNAPINDENYSPFVIKVYRSDQSFKYFPLHKETTAKQVVMLAISEFGIVDPSRCYSLCEVSFEHNAIKQKRLPDHIDNLPERLPINARYYLKNNHSTETLVPDHLSNELLREGRTSFLQLDSLEICAQLTLRDFALFKSIQTTEYIDHVFKLKSAYGIPQLEKFLKLPNEEMYWTITEIMRENNLVQRSKVIKHLIKIAKCCKDMKNFNSMFAIVSGLDHKSVQRLQSTWERVPDKHKKTFEELKSLLDLSRNMSVYRNLLKNESVVPPIIPMFPVCMKDLTFIHLGNPTQDDGLINFEKLRMIAKEIRQITNMASSPYDISNMFDSPTSHSQIFAGFGHQSATDSFGTIRRHQTYNRGSSIIANAKRIYDESLMVKKVKTYLNNAEIINDENRLLEFANQFEPVALGGIPASPPMSLSKVSAIVDESEFCIVNTPKMTNVKEEHHDVDNDKHPAITKIEDKHNNHNSNNYNSHLILRPRSSPSRLRAAKTALYHVSTLKRRPSPSTSSLSSNSSCDRRAAPIQLTKFGTQSPDAVNRLLRLSDSSHQIKARAPQRPNQPPASSNTSSTSIVNSTSPVINNITTSTGLSSFAEPSLPHRHQHLAKMRDTNKLTSESSSLNFKPPTSTSYSHLIRSHTQINQNNNDLTKEIGGDSGRGSLNSTDTCVGDGSEKSSSTIGDGFSSVKIRNRPPIPQSNSVTSSRHDGAQMPKLMRNWLQRSQSENEVTTTDVAAREGTAVDFDEHEQVTAV
ncbi:unnamed protein product [Rotaria magnacalcarata]|uniref:Uncharacterized protein n=2 Tax=Rotaria magnacalcarata TaxID=392030 RepID=A0A816YTG1_9BILA|nr:unnamed protein product [Rotaria magnacalcarata]